jgi:hypothetical protein
MDGQTIYKKITVPEALKSNSMEGALFGKESKALTTKAETYMSARRQYLNALDRGASTRSGLVSVLKCEATAATAYMDYAKAMINSGKPDSDKVGCSAMANQCRERLGVIDAMLASIED